MAQHMAVGQGKGTDFGNTRCGAPVLAMAAGTVYSRYIQPKHNPPLVGDGSLIIRLRHIEGWTTGYAHMSSFAAGTSVGSVVQRGQMIGPEGGSGGVPCHLHADSRLNGVAVDLETRLEQNHNFQFNDGLSMVNLREAPSTAAVIWGTARPTGIFHGAVRVADAKETLLRRTEASVTANGYEWLPFTIPQSATPLWVARNFVHFL